MCFSVCISPSLGVPESLFVLPRFHVLISACPLSLCFSALCILSFNVLECLHILSLCNLLSMSPCLSVPMNLCVSLSGHALSLCVQVFVHPFLCITFCVFSIFCMSLNLCMWSNVCASLSLGIPISIFPQVFPWTLVIQFKCIPESLYSCVWVSFYEHL